MTTVNFFRVHAAGITRLVRRRQSRWYDLCIGRTGYDNVVRTAESDGRREGEKVCLGRARALNNCSRFLLDQGQLSTRVAVARPRGPKLFNAPGRRTFHSTCISLVHRKVRGQFNYHGVGCSCWNNVYIICAWCRSSDAVAIIRTSKGVCWRRCYGFPLIFWSARKFVMCAPPSAARNPSQRSAYNQYLGTS